MRWVVKFACGMAAAFCWEHAGLEIWRWEYWAIMVLFIIAGAA
jgi:hypothetical protein